MNTQFLKAFDASADTENLIAAAEVIRQGGLVAFPTETVYGLGGNGLNPESSRKIYAAKGRPSDNPLILHISEREELLPLVKEIPACAEALMNAFWPGPLTLIFPKSDRVPKETTGGLDTVAVRMPSHPIARELIRLSGVPIAAPSANTSGRPSPTTAAHVLEDMDGRIEMILNGGEVGIGLESTIIDCTGDEPLLLRPGFITMDMIRRITANAKTDRASVEVMSADAHPKAPGMKYRHYAPQAELILVEGEHEAVLRCMKEKACEAMENGKRTRILCVEEDLKFFDGVDAVPIGTKTDLQSVAHRLFAVLRDADADEIEAMFCETFSEEGLGFAIMNRLIKAAGHHVIRA